jgi:hypothetical protein
MDTDEALAEYPLRERGALALEELADVARADSMACRQGIDADVRVEF